MHFAKEVIRQPAVIVQSTEIGTANIADLQFLVARRTRGILKILKFSFARLLLVFCRADLV